MSLSGIKKNFIYNVIYQLMIIALPLISVPYVSRVMGVEGMGEYSYTFSIVTYFMLISMLGINNYGNKKISHVRDNKEELSRTFWEIYFLQLITTVTMIICYICYLLFFCKEYVTISWVLLAALASCAFDINWIFFGLEKFKITVTRNAIIKLLSVIMVFTFVKSTYDVWIYTLIMSSATLLSQVIMWPFLKKEVSFCMPNLKGIFSHFNECLVLFFPVIAYSVYKIMGKTMLGSIKEAVDLGYFEYAEKIYNIPIGLITALGTVMLPRISYMLSKKENSEVVNLVNKSFEFVFFISIPMALGLIAVADNFTVVFLGKEYADTGQLLSILSISIIFVSIANVIRTQILIPLGKNKEYVTATVVGAAINLTINLALIPKLGPVGACIGTVSAEFIVMFMQLISVRKVYLTSQNLKKFFQHLGKGLIMLVCVLFANQLNISKELKLVFQVGVGGSVYCLLNFKYILLLLGLRRSVDGE